MDMGFQVKLWKVRSINRGLKNSWRLKIFMLTDSLSTAHQEKLRMLWRPKPKNGSNVTKSGGCPIDTQLIRLTFATYGVHCVQLV